MRMDGNTTKPEEAKVSRNVCSRVMWPLAWIIGVVGAMSSYRQGLGYSVLFGCALVVAVGVMGLVFRHAASRLASWLVPRPWRAQDDHSAWPRNSLLSGLLKVAAIGVAILLLSQVVLSQGDAYRLAVVVMMSGTAPRWDQTGRPTLRAGGATNT
jgi:hypothetical protein